jgi:hypothetical protein
VLLNLRHFVGDPITRRVIKRPAKRERKSTKKLRTANYKAQIIFWRGGIMLITRQNGTGILIMVSG